MHIYPTLTATRSYVKGGTIINSRNQAAEDGWCELDPSEAMNFEFITSEYVELARVAPVPVLGIAIQLAFFLLDSYTVSSCFHLQYSTNP